MNRIFPVFSIRTLLFATALVALLAVLFKDMIVPRTVTFSPIETIAKEFLFEGWRIEVSPDLKGPYRVLGTVVEGSNDFASNLSATVKAGGLQRKFDYAVEEGEEVRWVGLETIDKELTFLIVSKKTDREQNKRVRSEWHCRLWRRELRHAALISSNLAE